MPDAAVIIPAYNAGAWIRRTVETAASPDAVRSVIVVDDGSPEPFGAALEGLRVDAEVLVHRKSNGGGASARNVGAELFLERGHEWAVLLDHDDELAPEVTDALRVGEQTGAALVVSEREEFAADGWRRTKRRRAHIPVGEPIPFGAIHEPMAIWTATGLAVHRRVFEAGCRFDTSLSICDDIDFMRRAGRADVGPLVVSDAIALRRRVHRDGKNLSGWRTLARRVDEVLEIDRRWHEPDFDAGFRETATWLFGQVLKRRVRGPAADQLADRFAERNWALPVKTRARYAWHRLVGRSSLAD